MQYGVTMDITAHGGCLLLDLLLPPSHVNPLTIAEQELMQILQQPLC